jgi:hypothetical protein
VPCKIVRENAYPRELSPGQREEKIRSFLHDFSIVCSDRHEVHWDETSLEITLDGNTLIAYRESLDLAAFGTLRGRGMSRLILLTYGPLPAPTGAQETILTLKHRQIAGPACPISERLLNQLRRYGTRFRYKSPAGHYQPWNAG